MDYKAKFIEVSAYNNYTEYEKVLNVDLDAIHTYYVENGNLIINISDLHLPLKNPKNQKLYDLLQKLTIKV